MDLCSAEPVLWKNRAAFRLSNGKVELIMLLGGGHLADLRLCGSPINVLWEAPWPTIDPQQFSPDHGERYGEGPVGKLLSGYTGQAVVVGYFGMPNAAEAARGLALHGEAASSEWHLLSRTSTPHACSFVAEVELPVYHLRLQREVSLRSQSCVVSIHETVFNGSDEEVEFQWVEHAAFGPPLFAPGEASLSLPGTRGRAWPLGYEGHELLPNDVEFHWPRVQSIDLSEPFLQSGTGFVASVLLDPARPQAFVAVHNRKLALACGYLFDRTRFPWVALWEENRARHYPPWNGITQVRGVEFGTSPMPLGLEQARQTRTLFGQPVLISVAGKSSLSSRYKVFVSSVPPEWNTVTDVEEANGTLMVHCQNQSMRLCY